MSVERYSSDEMRTAVTLFFVLVVIGVFSLQFWTATTIFRFDWHLFRGIWPGRAKRKKNMGEQPRRDVAER